MFFLILPLRSLADQIPSVWNVPAENYNFVGREEALQTITELFKNAPLKTAVLSGPSGFGKSQIAKRYIYKNYPHYDIVWWFSENQYLELQFEEFSLELGAFLGLDLEERIKTIDRKRLIHIIKEAIRKKNLKCLFVFEDAQTYRDIEPYIPFSHGKNVHVIITTKNANFSAHTIQVKPFKREESIAYIHLFFPDEVKEIKDDLASHLADCPTSLAFAVEYIKNYPGMTIETYIRKHDVETATSSQILSEAAKKLGGTMDAYERELFMAIKMNLEDLQLTSPEAFQLISFLSLLNHTEINVNKIKKWLEIRQINYDMLELMSFINKYSFVETTTLKDKKKVYLSMQELIQKIISTFVPLNEKKQLIEECSYILLESFSGRSDQNAETILKDIAPLLHATKISEEAMRINYYSSTLSSLRIKVFDVLLCGLRDPNKAKVINKHLQEDLKQGIQLSNKDQILYNINLSVFSAMQSSDYKRALDYGTQASDLLGTEGEMYEEKIRLVANLIQYLSLIGNLDQCENLVKRGEDLLPLSQSEAYNALFIFATTMYLLDKGDLHKTINLIVNNKNLLSKLSSYPSIHFYILNQLAEAFLKQGNTRECQKTLKQSEKKALGFYADKKNTFFANLDVLKAACSFNQPNKFKNSEGFIKQALETYAEILQGEDKHRGQAFAHLMLGKLYALHAHYDQAKKQYLISEEIFEKVLQNKKIDDVSELYKSLATLGVDMQDEALTQKYLDKQIEVFGLDHPKTKEISLYFDKREFILPL